MSRSRAGRSFGGRPLFRRLADYALAALILFLLLVLVALLQGPVAPPARGVAIVNDGDSITLSGQRVRLRGIDAPEYSQTCSRGGKQYACGREARASLQALISSRAVICEGGEMDRYGRLLGECRTGQTDLNAAQVAAGWAISFGGYQSEETEAKRKKLGLWSGEFDRPGDWRATHGHATEPSHDFLTVLGNRLKGWLAWLLGRA